MDINDVVDKLLTKYQDDVETLLWIKVIIEYLELKKFGQINPGGF